MQSVAEPHMESSGLPPLTLEQRAALRDSIRTEGVLSPIVQDQFGAVICRGDAVTGQHAEGEWLGQSLLAELLVH